MTKKNFTKPIYLVGKIADKAVCRSECIFDNIALYYECRINKNALLQTVFLPIFPTGLFPRIGPIFRR